MRRVGVSIDGIIPEFNLADRFCYFLSLAQDYSDNEISRKKKELYMRAKTELVSPVIQQTNIDRKNELPIIKTAIEFLKTVARSERNKEIRVINKYIQSLNTELSGSLSQDKQKELNEILTKLEEYSNNPAGKTQEDLNSFYIDLTKLINDARQNTKKFEYELKRLTSSEDQRITIASNTLFRTENAIQKLLGSLKDNVTPIRSITKYINEKIKNWFGIQLEKLKNNKELIDNAPGILIVILLKFYDYIQINFKNDIFDISGKGSLNRQKQAIDKLFDTFVTEEEKIFKNIDELIQFSNMAKKIINLSTTESTIATLEKEKHTKTDNFDKRQINQSSSSFDLIDMKYSVSKNSFWYELVEALRKMGAKIEGTPATDVIAFDFATMNAEFSLKNNPQQDIINQLEELGKINALRKNRLDNLTKKYEQASQQIAAKTKEITEQLKSSKITEDFFIFHESLKLYEEIDDSKKRTTFEGFHGRNINIYNALDSLYTANGINDLSLMDPKLLYGIAVNLADFAVGASAKTNVENYLSIFAGLLMFDDIQNIAQDAAIKASNEVEQYGSAYNIHLFLLNDIYVPGSYLLTSIAYALENGYQQIQGSAQAHAIITTPSFTDIATEIKVKNNSDSSNSKKKKEKITVGYKGIQMIDRDSWSSVSNKVINNTKLQITFLNGFINFIKSLEQSI